MLTGMNIAVNLLGLLISVYVFPWIFFATLQQESGLKDKPNSTYDYIIVGAGAAGSVLANRLSEDGDVTVLLLEAGSDDRDDPDVPTPALFSTVWHKQKSMRIYSSQAENGFMQGLRDNRLLLLTGRALGGGTSVNVMNCVRGSRHDFDQWAAYTKDQTWSYDHVLPYFKKFEGTKDSDLAKSVYHNTNGPIGISMMRNGYFPITQKIVEAFQEIGYPYNEDYNGKNMEGVSYSQMFAENGKRSSTARTYIHPVLGRPNLDVIVNAHVQKVIIKNKKAMGVEVIKNGRKYKVEVRREVILSAGGIGSPQILMLSGIGKKKELEKLNIKVKEDLPVGENLQDHVFVVFPVHIEEPITSTWEKSWLTSFQYSLLSSGPLASSGSELMFFISTTKEAKAKQWPDLQILFDLKPMTVGHMQGMNYDKKIIQELSSRMNVSKYGFICLPVITRMRSRGSITLESSDPFDDPIIRVPGLMNDEDVNVLTRGLEICQKLARSKAMASTGPHLMHAEPISLCKEHKFNSSDYWKCAVRGFPVSMSHYSGSCKMGAEGDATAVLDSQLRVRGVSGLRVVDASVMPYVVTGNTEAPVVMIAEKAADLIRGKQPLPPEKL